MNLLDRESPIDMSGKEFRQVGHQLVDAIAPPSKDQEFP